MSSRAPAQLAVILASLLLVGCHRFGALPFEPPSLAYCDTPSPEIQSDTAAKPQSKTVSPMQAAYIRERGTPIHNSNDHIDNEAKLQGKEPPAKKAIRNDIVNQIESDLKYSHASYMANASRHRDYFQTGTDIIVLGLTASTTVVGGVAAKAAFGAAATGVGGIKTSFLSDFDGGMTRANLLTGMLKNNLQNEQAIDDKLKLSYDDYPLSAACKDLMTYYLGGTEEMAFATVPPTDVQAKPTGDGKPKADAGPKEEVKPKDEVNSKAEQQSSDADTKNKPQK